MPRAGPRSRPGRERAAGWQWHDHDISFLDGQPGVYVRFRLTTDASLTSDGVYLDDVVRALLPGVVRRE